MKIRVWALAVMALAAMAMGGCGKSVADTDGGTDGSAGEGGLTDVSVDGSPASLADTWCPDFAERFCAAADRCGCSPIPGFGDETACRERAERTCRSQLEAAAGDPRLELAGAVPEGCLSAFDEALAECRLPEPDLFAVRCPLVWPRDFSRTLPGTGAACAEGLCAEGARCGSEGTCAMTVPGGSCVSPSDCPDGDRCDDGSCRALDFEGAGGSCAGPDACEGDLRCLAATRRECAPLAPGGACTGDEGCVAGEFCAEGTCATSPGVGEACGNGVACAPGLGCRFAPGPDQDTCQAPPGSGEPCALAALGPFLCAEGLACRDRRCGPIPTEGEACAGGELRCVDGLGCFVEDVDSVCRPRVGAGSDCGLDDSCAVGLYCDFRDGRCASVLVAGEVCRDGNECGDDGACVPDETAAMFRCVPRPREGEGCFLDGSCEAGLVCRSPFAAGVCAPPMCATHVF